MNKIQEILESGQAPGFFVRKNISYPSPITGEIIQSHRKRQYDLEKHDCMDYREAKECAEDARKSIREKNKITTDDIYQVAQQLEQKNK